jgi:vanillin dehydrogenase
VRQAYLGKGLPAAASHPTAHKESTMSDLSMLINGLAVSAEKGATFERRNPLDGSVATRAPAASEADAVAAVEAAAEAFKTWSQTGPSERRALLLKAADALEAKTPKFVEAVPAETGATGMWAGFNVMLAAGMIREAASLTTQIGGEVIPSDVPGSLAMGVRQPAGVVLGIAPWNAPIILGVRAIAVPLACGNTVVLKGSENCPRTHQLIVEAFQDAGFPAGVVNYVTNAPADAGKVVEAMIAHPAVRRVNFTGSTRVGKLIALTCAKYLKPVVLELGGKAPLVVLDDADLDDAVNAAAFGAFANSGQICMSTERIIVDRKVADDFVASSPRRRKGLPLGDPRKPEPVVLGSGDRHGHGGALQRADRRRAGQGRQAGVRRQGRQHADARHAARPRDAEDAHLPRGDLRPGEVHRARRRRGGGDRLRQRQRVRPVGRGLRPRHRARHERGAAHRIRHLPRQRPDRARRGADAVRRRQGLSGYGRFGGKAGIAEFTELRWITVQTTPRHYPF